MKQKQLPPIGKLGIEEAKRSFEDGLYYNHPLYTKWRSTYRRSELYDQGAQWLQAGPSAFDGGTSLSQWASIYYEPNDPNYIPTPVFNEGHGSRTNESARLGRPNYRPVVRPKSENPSYKVREAARKATDVLRHRLKEIEWDRQAYVMYYHIPVYGGVWLRSEWEQRWDKTAQTPLTSAMKCPDPECPFLLSSPRVGPNYREKASFLGSELAPIQPDLSYNVTNCPTCPGHPPLQPFSPTLGEAATGHDFLGRSLGTAQPLGDWLLSVRSPYDVFPKNLGFMMAPGDVNEWREVHVETLDWVALHYPEKADKVEPDRPDVIAKYHPLFGAPDMYGSVLDSKVLKEAVRVMEWHKKPWMERVQDSEGNVTFRLNEGRSIIIAGDQILLDAPFLIPSPTDPLKKVPRILMDYVPWEVRDGARYLQGLSLWELLFDPQDNANEIRSQAQSVRQRLAVPLYIALKEHNLEIATRDGVPGRFAFIDVHPDAPNMVPQIINNSTIADGVWRELQDTVSSLEKYAGNVEVEKGQVPPNVEAALAIQYLKTYAGEKREPRIKRIEECLKRLWKHGLELMTAFYIEPREVSYENEAGEERWSFLLGEDIKGEVNITVESEADFDEKARSQELVLSLSERGFLNPQDPNVAREVARILDAPESLFEEQDIQKDAAQREYIEFKESGKIPVVDPSLDDHAAHARQHGIDSMGEYCRSLEEAGNWDGALKVLGANWDLVLQQAMMTPAPVCLQEKIYQAWTAVLQQASTPPIDPMTGVPLEGVPLLFEPPQDAEALDKILRWRAHLEDHRLQGQLKQLQAMQQPVLAAPGAPEAEGGLQPTPENPAQTGQ